MNGRTVARGVGLALGVAVPAVLVVQIADSLTDADGILRWVAAAGTVVVAVGLGAGGWSTQRAGHPEPRRSGLAVGLLATLALLAIAVVRLVLTDGDIVWWATAALLVMGGTVSWLGADFAQKAARTRP